MLKTCWTIEASIMVIWDLFLRYRGYFTGISRGFRTAFRSAYGNGNPGPSDFSGEVMDLEVGDSPGDWIASAKVRRTLRVFGCFLVLEKRKQLMDGAGVGV